MGSDQRGRAANDRRNNTTPGLDPIVTGASSSSSTFSKLELVQKAFMSPFTHKKNESTRILSERKSPKLGCWYSIYRSPCIVAPVIMTPRMINTAANVSSKPRASLAGSSFSRSGLDFATLGRAPLRLGLGSRRITSGDLQIFEAAEELLEAEVPEPEGVASNVSLLRGFNATIPSAEQSKTRRRQMRSVETPRLGLKRLGLSARGLLMEEEDHEGRSVASEDDVVVVRHPKKKGRESLSAAKKLGTEELSRQTQEIVRDKENIHVKRVRIPDIYIIFSCTRA